MIYINGDLIRFARNGKFDVIVHGCNCFNTMGAGIAAQVRKECPEAYMVDQMTQAGDRSKLGTITYAVIEPKAGRDVQFTCVNLYSQFDYSREHPAVNYNAIRAGLKKVRGLFSDKSIGMPLLGAGLAGGDWSIIEQIIKEELEDHDVDITIVRFK